WEKHMIEDEEKHWPSASTAIEKYTMEKWTDNINREPYTSRGVRTVRRRVLGNTTIAIWKGAGYLAYIVATSVKANGDRTDLRLRDYVKSVILCKQLEKEFGLERLMGVIEEQKQEFAIDHAQKVVYGEPGLKRAISDVLNTVVDHYNYTSLDELNAILKQYNVTANPGEEGSRLNKVGGLLYHAIHSNGSRVGVPIKASLFLLKPTLKNLEQRFTQNQAQRETHREQLSTAIEWALAGRAPNWEKLREDLEKKGIIMVINTEKDKTHRMFFVDHGNKCDFEGKNLGSGYALDELKNRCTSEERITEEITLRNKQRLHL